jgi:phosphoribosylformylglycinamidine cyclo-ligase
LLERAHATPETKLGDGLLYDALLAPTRIYVKSVLALMQHLPVHGVAHITGGGLLENIPRVVPEGLEVVIDRKSWTLPPVFQWLQQQGNINEHEMLRTFNCGVGMTICVAPDHVDQALALLKSLNEPAFIIGKVRSGTGGVVIEG